MPEVTEEYIRIPVAKCTITATIDISPSEGIKALYCGGEKKVATYLFERAKGWTMAKGKSWIKEHKEVKAMEIFQLKEGKPVMLFPFGKWKTEKYGTMDLTQEFAEQIIDNYDKRVLGTQPFFDDGNHAEDKATGWIKRLFVQANALFADVEWTKLGKELLGSKVYQYSSIHVDKHKNPVDGKEYYPVLKNVSLTNIPVLRMLPAIELSELVEIPLNELANPPAGGAPKTDIERVMEHYGISEEEARVRIAKEGIEKLLPPRGQKTQGAATLSKLLADIDALLAIEGEDSGIKSYLTEVKAKIEAEIKKGLTTNAQEGEGDYESNSEEVEKQMDKELREMLGIGEDADVLETVRGLKEKAEKPATESVSLSEHQKMSEDVKSLKTKLAERDRDEAVKTAIGDGKVIPAQREWASKYAMADPSGFAEFVKGAPKALTLGEKGGDGEPEVELTSQEVEQAKYFGMSEADLLAGKKELKDEEAG